MDWTMEIKRGGVVEQKTSGHVEDPFLALAMSAKMDRDDNGRPLATVEARLSHWGEHVSIGFTVTVQCPQTQPHIEYAAHLAYVTATRFVNDAASRLDSSMPLLPTG